MYTPILFVREVKTRIKRYIPWLPFENRFRFYQVEKDKFYRSSQLTEEALEYFTKEGLIGSLVILRKNPRKHEFEFAKKHNIALLHIPIYMRAPTEKEEEEFFNFVRDVRHHPVVVHCAQGKDRTGYFVCRYRVECMGWNIQDAWKEMIRLGHCAFPWDGVRQAHFRKRLEEIYNTKLRIGC